MPRGPTYRWATSSKSSYLQAKAAEIKKRYRNRADLGRASRRADDAICRYVNGMQDTAAGHDVPRARWSSRGPFLGSVAAACIRKAGVAMLIYWPDEWFTERPLEVASKPLLYDSCQTQRIIAQRTTFKCFPDPSRRAE